MLRATFLHIDGIGPAREASLWRAGVRDWSELPQAPGLDGQRSRVEGAVRESEAALAAGNVAWFGERLPRPEHWRLFPAFAKATAYLDIETTSLSPYEGYVTVVTVHAPNGTRSFVQGEDLEELPAYLRRYPILVTFNGTLFDVPFLQVHYPGLVPPPAHIDLRFLLYRIGQAGGLKRIEERLGIGSRAGVEGVKGLDAVRLWDEYRRGNRASLERLIQYNRADAVNLEPLLRHAVRELTARLLLPAPKSGARS